MNRHAHIFYVLVLTLAALAGCTSKPPAGESKKAAVKLDTIQGKVQIFADTTGSGDAALNPGGPAVYLWVGTQRYRLFSRTLLQVTPGREHVVEGINAQKLIDEIGDPDQGKNGYPLPSSCERVVTTAWRGLAFDAIDANSTLLRDRVSRYPARPVFLVTQIRLATEEESAAAAAKAKKEAAEKDVPIVSVPAAKQAASLVEGSTVLTAPLWDPAGRTISCKVIIDTEGKVSELETGAQLCEAAPWSKFSYKPLTQGGRPVKVRTEVEIRWEARK